MLRYQLDQIKVVIFLHVAKVCACALFLHTLKVVWPKSDLIHGKLLIFNLKESVLIFNKMVFVCVSWVIKFPEINIREAI